MDLTRTASASAKDNSIIQPPPPMPSFLALKQQQQQSKEDCCLAKKLDLSLDLSDESYVDLDEIVANLYLGSWQSAVNLKALKLLNVTHILTMEESELPDDVQRLFTCKFKHIVDSPYSNLLVHFDDCFQFIDEALAQSTSILVHWYRLLFYILLDDC